ncbi:hypothetical protein E4U34_006316, partial [Claviceps purpurea]
MGSTNVAENSPIPLVERHGSEASSLPWDGADGHARLMPSLPPVDGGKHAWFFLTACFVVEALTWGFPSTFGLFQNYYSTHEPFAGSEQIPIIGTCAM